MNLNGTKDITFGKPPVTATWDGEHWSHQCRSSSSVEWLHRTRKNTHFSRTPAKSKTIFNKKIHFLWVNFQPLLVPWLTILFGSETSQSNSNRLIKLVSKWVLHDFHWKSRTVLFNQNQRGYLGTFKFTTLRIMQLPPYFIL